ncbi:MAG: LeuA family protein [Armatimonadota bacterium]|nr:LeuA family protein [Armatimonadota bacterium]MDR7428172.1 LeuA family protein [Armatimonadota bacterium]MDR7469799.1 LeuA family protein [Armatimonadota bacterium]MDR7474698.1 LeuA family protein [Armatimonadota bacterium]MDR7539435.1 LeuA family protein [Armatimonadota bacterium]
MREQGGGRQWIYEWNAGRGAPRPARRVEVNDETLRDGLQSPSVIHPPLETKCQILHLMAELGIESANIGYPAAGPRALEDVVRLAQEIGRARLPIRPNCAGRTTEADITPIAEAQDRSGVAIDAALFIGSSPIRQYAEGWGLDFLRRTTEQAVTLARRLGLEVMFVTEDTTRARPAHLRALYTTAIECGARRICLADTVGHATPWGVRRLVRFMRRVVEGTGREIKIDWHGHRDRGLDLINSLAAIEAGADRIHACALGIGERVGNTPMDLLLVNLKLLGWRDADLSALPRYCETVARAVGLPIPCNYPVVGKDAFETSTGVHAAAILKAYRKGHHWLANRIYSGVPAEEVGRQQVISVGPMSGQANVVCWLQRRGIEPVPRLVEAILDAAKASDRVLRDEEILSVILEQISPLPQGGVSA